ncbi:hypothetical protein SDC9_134279 [bioreactor metagenome]|uniref:Uncharacterized protein n=1 Tax=bioreactor metagenome TaxID=1076179 RepID=A0A645DDA3_9ZZZZ|nr:hypothetical protein [Oscillospiraceae bacterium]
MIDQIKTVLDKLERLEKIVITNKADIGLSADDKNGKYKFKDVKIKSDFSISLLKIILIAIGGAATVCVLSACAYKRMEKHITKKLEEKYVLIPFDECECECECEECENDGGSDNVKDGGAAGDENK